MAPLPGVKTAVAANIRKNPASVRKSTVPDSGDSKPTVKARASEAVRTAAPASAENAKTARTETKLSKHYEISESIRKGTTGAVRSNMNSKYGVPTTVDYSTFDNTKDMLKAAKEYSDAQLAKQIAFKQQQQANMYAQLNAMQSMYMKNNLTSTAGAALGNLISNIGGSKDVYSNVSLSNLGSSNSGVKVASTLSANASPLESMKAANDSASLQSALTAARANQSEVTTQLQTLKSDMIQLENDKNKAEKDLEQLNKDIATQTQVVESKQEAVDTANEKVSNAKRNQDGAKKGLEQATAVMKEKDDEFKQAQIGVENAQTALSTAQTNLASANARLASTPATLPDGSTNPAYAPAKQAVADAEQAVKEKKEDLAKAQQARQEAADAYKAANENQTAAQTKLEQSITLLENAENAQAAAEDEVVKAKKELETEKEKLENLNAQKDAADGVIQKYNDAVEQQTELEKQVADYEKEIPKQEQRLEKLKEKENKEMKGLDGDISKLEKEVADLKAKGKEDKANEKQAKLDGLNARKEELQNIINQRNFVTEMGTDGKVLKSGYVNGEQVFMIGDKEVSQAEFNAAKASDNTPVPKQDTPVADAGSGEKKSQTVLSIVQDAIEGTIPVKNGQVDVDAIKQINEQIDILKDSSRSSGTMSAQGHDIKFANGQFTIDGQSASEKDVRKLIAESLGIELT